MTKQEKQKNIVIPLASLGGGGGVLALVVWAVAQFGQIDANAASLKKNCLEHETIKAQVTALKVGLAETETRSEAQHKETLRRFDELATMIRDIKR